MSNEYSKELQKKIHEFNNHVFEKRFEFHTDDGETGYGVLIDNNKQEFTLEGINEESYEYFKLLVEYLNSQEESVEFFKFKLYEVMNDLFKCEFRERKAINLIEEKINNIEEIRDGAFVQHNLEIRLALFELKSELEELFQ